MRRDSSTVVYDIVRSSLEDPALDVMNFLNDAVQRYPEAISFAPGRPSDQHLDVEHGLRAVSTWIDHSVGSGRWSREDAFRQLGQYGRTNGFIADLIARQLERDEGIRVPDRAVMITSGCQEAMAILLTALFDPSRDALLVSDPSYIGITGLAKILEIPLVPVAATSSGLDPEAVRQAVEEVRRSGLRPRAIYDVPDFNNPLGTTLSLERRHALLDLADREDFLVLEDNPYGMFAYDGDPLPTLKALDRKQRVIYLGTFSKTLFPGLRLGFLVADQTVTENDHPCLLAETLSRVKSLITVNTSPVLQAIAGGLLLEQGCSLRALISNRLPFYRSNRDRMIQALTRAFGDREDGVAPVSWCRPGGGFFLTVRLPFRFGRSELESCARDYGVVCCPLSFFSLAGLGEDQVRLSFSYVTPEQIDDGIGRFAAFVGERLTGRKARPLKSARARGA